MKALAEMKSKAKNSLSK